MNRLLHIEDDEVDQEMVRRLLGPDLSLVVTNTARKGLEIVRNDDNIDCILLDNSLPQEDGLELLSEFVRLDLPIVMLTGSGNEMVAVTALKEGATDYVVKEGLTRSNLSRAISQAIATHRMKRELESKRRELEFFAHTVAHDLKAPIATIQGYCKLLESEIPETDEGSSREFLDQIHSLTQRIRHQIDDLLRYAAIGATEFQKEPVDLSAVVSDVSERLSDMIQHTGAVIDAATLPSVHGNSERLTALLQNLIANAIKYRRDTPPQVRVSADEEDAAWHVMIADNGEGIPQEHRESIFTPLTRLHSSASVEGTGLGLATCKRIVELHEGRIWVESQPGQGSTFHFTLPKP